MRRFSSTHFYLFSALIFALAIVLDTTGQAQTFQLLHIFTGGQDGYGPSAGLTMDRTGNLYGTAAGGGGGGAGTVFKMTHKNGGWLFTPLYSFAGGNDGGNPYARVIFGPDGSLYGTTFAGGGCSSGGHCGTVFNLRPSASACKAALCPWTETVLYRFTGGGDGGWPGYGDLTFDQVGNIYGTTQTGGNAACDPPSGCGTVFKLVQSSGGQWTENVLYSFTGLDDGAYPAGSVIFDQSGSLYGTTARNGTYGCGTVFELTPSGAGWTERTLYEFNPSQGDGCVSVAALIFDQLGNLYGTNSSGGLQDGGTVFELTPQQDGTWTEAVLYSFTGTPGSNDGPFGGLAVDAAGNLCGTTYGSGAYLQGNVFKLTPSNGAWEYTSLHDFTGGGDGSQPWGAVVFDSHGNLYGTASSGGANGNGVVWEITP